MAERFPAGIYKEKDATFPTCLFEGRLVCLCYSFRTNCASQSPLQDMLSLPYEFGLDTSSHDYEESQGKTRLLPLLEVPAFPSIVSLITSHLQQCRNYLMSRHKLNTFSLPPHTPQRHSASRIVLITLLFVSPQIHGSQICHINRTTGSE